MCEQTWPEQNAVDAWFEKYASYLEGIEDLNREHGEAFDELKHEVSKYRIEVQQELETVKVERDNYRKKLLDALSYSLASDNLGVYPASITGGPNAYEKRTKRMEGHNEAVMINAKLVTKANEFLKALDPKLQDLIISGAIEVGVPEWDSNECFLHVDCSDLFFWGCSDSEEITLEEIPALEECLRLSPKNGPLLWCARKREMRPQPPYYQEFSEEEKVLFDACGPERQPGSW